MPDEFLKAWVAVRTMEHFERMEMIRRGMLPAPYRAVQFSGGIMLAMLAIVLLAGLAFVVCTDEILLPGPHLAANAGWWAALPGAAFLALVLCRRARRSSASRRLHHKTIRDAGASLRLP